MKGAENIELRYYRRLVGMTQGQLSDASGVNQSVISDIENGKVKHPRIDTTIALAKALGVKLETLIGKEEKQ